MADEQERKAGALVLQSTLFREAEIPHGFTTRLGGVSAGVFGSLNFGNPGELPPEARDPPANIAENFRRAIAACGAGEGRELVQVHQVHGAAVREARRGGPAHEGPNDTKADAVVTDDPGRIVAVRVADCTPVLIATADGRVVAAVHAGWRGVVGDVVREAIAAMREIAGGRGAARLIAAVGPCIGPTAFEVGPEVVAEFRRVFGPVTGHVREHPERSGGAAGKAMVDLKGAIREQLIGAGLRGADVDVLPHCTVGDAAMFFSHRRDRGVTGRMAALIGPRAEG